VERRTPAVRFGWHHLVMPAVVRPITDERDGLLAFLAQQRHVLRVTAYGLNDHEARLTPTASAFSIEGILRHVTTVERSWAAAIAGRDSRRAAVEPVTIHDVVADHERACVETDAVVAVVDLDGAVPVPAGARWAPPDVKGWSVRWVLLHLIQETARHAGHADIIRESLDGATALPLMAAIEDWPPRRTITPWRRSRQ
jgi:uncharacterized damage-inducible protein DinB